MSSKETKYFPSVDEEVENAAIQQLVVQAQKGDKAAVQRLYELYHDKIFAYLNYRVDHRDWAEDLTSEVFLKILEKLHTYRDMGVPFQAWLYRIAHNHYANEIRNMNNRPETSLDLFLMRSQSMVSEDVLALMLVKRERAAQLERLIQLLPPAQRHVIEMKLVSGWKMTNAEIGESFAEREGKKRSEGSVKSLYFRALEYLRDRMSD